MAIAGKVAITLATENGGAWSADVTYDRFVAVKHNNSLYISRKVVTNVEPPNNEFWFFALEGCSGEDVQVLIDRMNAVISGTQQVGNSKTLDGHEAEYFERLGHKFDIFDRAGDMNTVPPFSAGIVYSNDANRPPQMVSGDYGLFYTIGHGDKHKIQRVFTPQGQIIERIYTGSKWYDWTQIATFADLTAELAEYLPLSAKPTGTYTGNGSATSRTINTGGISSCIMVRKSGERGIFAIVTESGYFAKDGSDGTDAYFASGVLTIASTSDAFNTNGATYWYQVL